MPDQIYIMYGLYILRLLLWGVRRFRFQPGDAGQQAGGGEYLPYFPPPPKGRLYL